MSRKNVAIRQSKMLAYRNSSNRVSENYRHTPKLNAYNNCEDECFVDLLKKIIEGVDD